MLEIKSPLKGFPGSFKVPEPDRFDGTQWQLWKKEINKSKRKEYANVHLFCYTGLALIKDFGEWDFEIPIEEMQTWEDKPDEERIKFVAWIGRTIWQYWDGIIDPKE